MKCRCNKCEEARAIKRHKKKIVKEFMRLEHTILWLDERRGRVPPEFPNYEVIQDHIVTLITIAERQQKMLRSNKSESADG